MSDAPQRLLPRIVLSVAWQRLSQLRSLCHFRWEQTDHSLLMGWNPSTLLSGWRWRWFVQDDFLLLNRISYFTFRVDVYCLGWYSAHLWWPHDASLVEGRSVASRIWKARGWICETLGLGHCFYCSVGIWGLNHSLNFRRWIRFFLILYLMLQLLLGSLIFYRTPRCTRIPVMSGLILIWSMLFIASIRNKKVTDNARKNSLRRFAECSCSLPPLLAMSRVVLVIVTQPPTKVLFRLYSDCLFLGGAAWA